ncbi:MAG TPA: DUF1579 domain-containing protein [Bacteroidota bacterium]|nr:DUF1579 domain-containing protein [Candidatus Kapabacteria bacterium]HRS01423.1 DUF1579 domain-containing protein [Bacteroidota bacterium]HRT68133.1 DUF1579 domain-containing protein [Bacteroidota bacterium]
MEKFNYVKLLVLICLLNLTSITISAQNEQSMDSPEMKAFMEYMTPSEMHKLLAKFDGDWETKTQFWMSPDSPPEISTGVAHNKLIFNGLYLQMEHSGKSDMGEFHGMGTFAYDNAAKEFQASWIDNYGTCLLYQTGKYNEKTKSIEIKGEFADPVSGKPLKTRSVYTYIDDNHWSMDMYNMMDGKEFKSMHSDYVKSK